MSRVSTQSILDEVYGGTATGGGSSIDDILGEVYGATPNVAAATRGVALPPVPSNIGSPLGAMSYMGNVVNAVAPQQANPPADTWVGRYFAGYANTLADFPSDVVRAGQALLQPAPGEMVKPDPYRVTGQQLGQIAGIVDQGTAMTKQAMGMPGLKPGGIPEAIGGGAANLGTQVVLGLATGGGSLPAQAGGFALSAAAPVVGQTMRDASNELGPGNEQRAAGEALTAGGITAATSLLPGAAILQKAGGGALVQKLLGIAQKSVGRRVGTAMLAEGGQELIEGVGQDFATRTMRRDESITPQMAMDILTDPQRAMDFALGAGLGGVARVPFEAGGSNAVGQNNPVGQTQNVPGTNGTVPARGGPVHTDASTVVPGGNAPQPTATPAVTNVDPAGDSASPDVTDEELAAMTDEEAARLFADASPTDEYRGQNQQLPRAMDTTTPQPSANQGEAQTSELPARPTSEPTSQSAWFIPPEQARRVRQSQSATDANRTPLASPSVAVEQIAGASTPEVKPNQSQDVAQGFASSEPFADSQGRVVEQSTRVHPLDVIQVDAPVSSSLVRNQPLDQTRVVPSTYTSDNSDRPSKAFADASQGTPSVERGRIVRNNEEPSSLQGADQRLERPKESTGSLSSLNSTTADLAAISKKAQSPVTIADDAKLTTTEKAHRDRASKGFGRRIVFVDTKANVEGAIVGSTPTTLYVKRELDGKRLTPVVTHEAMHSMRRTNPELASEVVDVVGLDRIKELGREQLAQQADAGYAADADENTLLDEGLARLGEEIAASRPEVASRLLETPGLWERFKTWIQSTLNKVGITRGSQEWTAVARALDKLESEHRESASSSSSDTAQSGTPRSVERAAATFDSAPSTLRPSSQQTASSRDNRAEQKKTGKAQETGAEKKSSPNSTTEKRMGTADTPVMFSAKNEDQKKYSYGFHGRTDGKDPAKTGYVTLTSDGKRNYAYGEDSRGGTMYEVRGNVKPVQASDIAKRVFHKLKADDPPFLSGVDLSYEGFLNSFDVGNIVDSAGWWDDPAFVSWFWENYQIPLVETKSGHVVLDPTEVTYNKVSNDDIRFSAKRDPAAQAAHDNAMNLEAEKGRRKSEVSAARTTAAIERRGAEAAQKETRDTIKNREKREKAFVTLVQQQQAENAQLSVQLGDASAEIQARRSAMKNMLSVITNAQRDLKRAAVNIQKSKDKAAAREAANETAARVRDAVVEIAKQLPPSLRGRMLTDVRDSVDMADLLGAQVSGKSAGGNRATQTFGALGKAADLLIRYNGREAKAEIVKMTKPRAMGKLSEKARGEIRSLVAGYESLYRQTQAPLAPASRADAAEQLVKIADDVRAIVRAHQLENKIIRWGRIADAMVVRNEVIESAKLASPELPFERKNPQLRQQPGSIKRGVLHMDRRADVIMRMVDNDMSGNGPLATGVERPIRGGMDKRYELIESVTNISNELAKDEGFEDIADLRSQTSGTLGEGLQKFEKVKIGGKEYRLSWGTLAKLVSSFDDVALGERLRKGRPVTFRGRENQTPVTLTARDEQAIRDALPDELYRVVKGMKRLRDQAFPMVQAAQRVVSGREAPSQPGYEPIITNRDQAAFAAEADPFDANFETKLIENSGFLKERVNDTSTPIIIGDFFEDFDRSIRNAADAAFLMVPLRNAREILMKPEAKGEPSVGNTISERFGEKALDRIRDAVRGVVRPPPDNNAFARVANKLERNTKVSLTAVNPGSLAIASIAPLPRIVAEIGLANTLKGIRTLATKGVRAQMMADSPWLRSRAAGTVVNINSMLPQIDLAPVDMELDAAWSTRMGEVWKATKRGGRAWVQNMVEAGRDFKAGDYREAGKNARQAFTRGSASIAEQIRFQSFIDSKVAQIIWEGTRQPGDTKATHKKRAEDVALRILPRSDSFAQTEWSDMVNRSGASSVFPFLSDANTTINHLTMAWSENRAKGIKVTSGFVVAALLAALIKGAEKAMRDALAGDDDPMSGAVDAALLRFGQETVGLPFLGGVGFDFARELGSFSGGGPGQSIAVSPITKTTSGLYKAGKALSDKLSSTDPKKVDSAMSRLLDGLLQAAEGLGQATKQPGAGVVPYVRAAAKGL